MRIALLTQPDPRAKSELRVYAYGHTASGWTTIPALTKTELPIRLQGQCALSTVLDAFGGMPEYDRFRVLAGGTTGSGEQLPLSLELDFTNH